MAPEQHDGAPATERADQFSLCVSMWQALYGGHPFAAGRWEPEEAQAAMRQDRVVPPTRRGVPARLERALRRGLRHDPAARWPSIEALAAALAPRRSRALAWGGAAVLAASAAAATALLLEGGPTPLERCRARTEDFAVVWPGRAERVHAAFAGSGLPAAERAAEKVGAALDRHAARWRHARLEVCASLHGRGERTAAGAELADRCLDAVKTLADGVLALVDGAARADLVRIADAVAALADPGDCVSSARSGVAPPPPERLAEVRRLEAELEAVRLQLAAGRVEATRPRAEALLAAAEATGYGPLIASCGAVVARLVEELGEPDAAARWRQVGERALAARDDLLAAGAFVRAALQLADGKDAAAYDATAALARAAVERVGATSLAADVQVADGRAALAAGRVADGRRLCEEIAVRDAAAVEDGGVLAQAASCAVAGALTADDLDAAARWAERALALAEAAHGAGTYETADELQSLAVIRRRQARLPETAALLGRARDLQAAVLGEDSAPVLRVDLTRAQLLDQLQRPAEGAPLAERAVAVLVARGDRTRTLVNAYVTLSTLRQALGDLPGAEAALAQGAALAREVLPPTDPFRAVATFNHARLLGAQEKYPAAEAALAEVEALWRAQGSPKLASVWVLRGELLRAQRRHRDAATAFDEAVAQLVASAHDPDLLAEARLGLAAVLWDGALDRRRAVAAAEAALRDADATGNTAIAADARAWLAAHAAR